MLKQIRAGKTRNREGHRITFSHYLDECPKTTHPMKGLRRSPFAGENTTTCDRCGATLHHGDYPFCPHTGKAQTRAEAM